MEDVIVCILRQDYHDTPELYDISEYANSQPITEEMCQQSLGCGIPITKVKAIFIADS